MITGGSMQYSLADVGEVGHSSSSCVCDYDP